MDKQILVHSLSDLRQVALWVVHRLDGSEYIALTGDLGSGKTAFTKLFAEIMGISQSVTSPTYTLLQEYTGSDGRLLVHGDAYRLGPGSHEMDNELVAYLGRENCCLVIEWADYLPAMSEEWTLQIHFQRQTESDGRVLTLRSKLLQWQKAFQAAV